MTFRALPTSSLAPADQVRYLYRAKVPESTTEEMLMDKGFWAHVANRLQFGAKIEVLAEEGTWYQEFIVAEAGNNWARVYPSMKRMQFVQVAPDEVVPEGYEIAWKGPALKFVVVRLQDSARLQGNFNTKNDAAKWLSDHIKSSKKAA